MPTTAPATELTELTATLKEIATAIRLRNKELNDRLDRIEQRLTALEQKP